MTNLCSYSANVEDGGAGVGASVDDEALSTAVTSPIAISKTEFFSVEAESSSSSHPALWEIGEAPIKQEVGV